jgi:hypothetical protein
MPRAALNWERTDRLPGLSEFVLESLLAVRAITAIPVTPPQRVVSFLEKHRKILGRDNRWVNRSFFTHLAGTNGFANPSNP